MNPVCLCLALTGACVLCSISPLSESPQEESLILFLVEEKFNLSANYCSHIEEHTNDSIYGEIEKEVVSFISSIEGPFLSFSVCEFQQCHLIF